MEQWSRGHILVPVCSAVLGNTSSLAGDSLACLDGAGQQKAIYIITYVFKYNYLLYKTLDKGKLSIYQATNQSTNQ